MADPVTATEIGRLPLHEEVAQVLRRRRVSGHVRVAVTTTEEARTLEEVLLRRRAEIERVPIGREVETPPPVRQEGDTVVIPVLEERLVLVRRLVVTEEIRFRLVSEEEAVSVPVTVRRQDVAVDRFPADPAAFDDRPGDASGVRLHDASHVIAGDYRSMTRTLTAMFDSRAEADRAAEALRGLNVQASNVQVHDSAAMGAASQDDDRQSYSSIGSSWMPEEDRATYHEGLRRGGAVVTADIAEGDLDLAMDAMEAAGAVDLDTREQEWRSQGWTGATTGATTGAGMGATLGASSSGSGTGTSAMLGGTPDGTPGNPPGTMASRGLDQVAGTNVSGAHPENETRRTGMTGTTTGATTGGTLQAGREEAIPLAEERLRIGKRVTHGGRVRVRTYVVETPVEEQVRLREEHVRVERHAVDRAATGTDAELFRERTIEAEESIEEAVVQKDVRVTGEVVVNKEATERTETVRDTVRRTEVDVDEEAAANDRLRRGDKGVA
jgi:uncharacterized protein (TIGR02271 family)